MLSTIISPSSSSSPSNHQHLQHHQNQINNQRAMRLTFETHGFHGYGLKFSPFSPNLLACAASQNYGLVGQGCLFILDHDSDKGIRCLRKLDWPKDGLFDLTWSEVNAGTIWTAGADGSIQIWDIGDPGCSVEGPVKDAKLSSVIPAHHSVISSIQWSQVRSDQPAVLTSSWDSTIKIWDGLNARQLTSFNGHEALVYEIAWSPLLSSTFASCSRDGTIRVWDKSTPPGQASLIIKASQSEILSCDWCKYDSNILVSGCSDKTIQLWDLRSVNNGPLTELKGHERAVKKVRFSPHSASIIASVSYDFTTRLWNYLDSDQGLSSKSKLIITRQNHSEFVYGLDFNVHLPYVLADCGWDRYICIFANQM
ncbi:peroxisomal targeting signal 2 receptor-like isoform X1 [Panonychus citri]|uniref:peroxisomal targeting signal 2 receptor-like isoform X1 n=2 Tax=Panonychus citri TaxID=50023 RepID=UPI0023079D74|nr:peroxisomal targeting signal 2 receptor-like isoform X1 [Panonychus citri]